MVGLSLQYHSATLALLDLDVKTSAERMRAIQEREAVCGRLFPASVKEWYALEGVDKLFCSETGDYLEPIERFGDPRITSQGYLCVGTENQAVVQWYVPLDSGDDPPVYDDNGLIQNAQVLSVEKQDAFQITFDKQPDLRAVNWHRNDGSFSAWIFEMIASVHCDQFYLTATDMAPSRRQLEQLGCKLAVGPSLCVDGRRVTHFFTEHACISIGWDDGAQDATWFVRTTTASSCRKLLQLVWNFGSLRETLKPEGGVNDAWAWEILYEFGRPKPRRPWWAFWRREN